MTGTRSYNLRSLLIPFSWLYGLVVLCRNALYDSGIFRSTGFNIPLISVGNITVGGTGKTPHVEYLVNMLMDQFRVATLSRGYKRKTRDFRLVKVGSTPAEAGDEPVQIKRRFPDITVAVDRSRVHGTNRLMDQEPPVDIIILDDAFQHRSIKPGFSILLADYNRPMEKDLLLPAGNLREPSGNRRRSNMILVTKCPEDLKPIERREIVKQMDLNLGQHLYFTTFRYGELIPVFEGTQERDKEWFMEHASAVLIVTGIARPGALREYGRSIHPAVEEMIFPDHHSFSNKEIGQIVNRYRKLKQNGKEVLVLTTEKDAPRLRQHTMDPDMAGVFHAVRIHVHFLNDDKENFDQQIRTYVNSNKRGSILHQGADQAHS